MASYEYVKYSQPSSQNCQESQENLHQTGHNVLGKKFKLFLVAMFQPLNDLAKLAEALKVQTPLFNF